MNFPYVYIILVERIVKGLIIKNITHTFLFTKELYSSIYYNKWLALTIHFSFIYLIIKCFPFETLGKSWVLMYKKNI